MYDRPIRSYSPYRLARRRRRWDSVSWWFSSLLALALLLWAFTWWFGIRDHGANNLATNRTLTFEVTNAQTGQPVSDAQIAFAGGLVTTDRDGRVAFDVPLESVELQISAPGFTPVRGEAKSGIDDHQSVALQPLPDGSGDQAIAARSQTSSATDETTQPASTEAPPTATAVITGEVATVTGTIRNAEDEPIWDATILSGSNFTRTAEDGTFQLDNVPIGTDLEIWASGFADRTIAAAPVIDVRMEPHAIKAAFLTAAYLDNEAIIQNIIDLAQTTEINAVVIDMKEGVAYYDSKVPFFVDADAVANVFDAPALVQRFKDAGLYTIARIVVFNDPIVAEAYPELAVETVDGDIWRGYNGDAWVNPYHQELWQPNIDLGIEAAEMGFDEIQLDYIRFPSDGDLSIAEFGKEHTFKQEERVGVIVDFLKEARDQFTAHHVKTGADVFAIVAVSSDDQGIGQRFADVTRVVDYISPMIYPSHFTAGALGMDEEPNAEPYETLKITMAMAAEKVPGMVLKIRPWLQDFTWGDPPYGPKEVRDQIDATMEEGGSGWMLWNPNGTVTRGALEPEESTAG